MNLIKPILGLTAVAVVTVCAQFNAMAEMKIADEYQTGGFAIGCQAYSFNHYTAFEAIEKTAETGGKIIEFYPGQKLSAENPDLKVDHSASDEVLAKLKAKLAQHKMMAVNYGVVGIAREEKEARKVFEFARKMGLRAITTESTEAIDTIEKLVKEYDIMVGFHNHPGNMKNPGYKVWSPHFIAGVVAGRDRRIGTAADTGHWARSNLTPVECLKVLEGRIISCHMKDLNQMGNGHDVPYGKGVCDAKGILNELQRQKFEGNISIEYEYNWTTSVPEIKACIDFVRDFGAGK